MRHPNADVDCRYLPGSDGIRGIMQVELPNKTTAIATNKYLLSTNDWILHLMRKVESF